MSSLHAVVMAGGAGTRFWPASRAARPKQFLPLADGRPLVAATIERLDGLCAPDHVWVATNRRQAKSLAKLLPNLRSERLILEPEPRDTAPCLALAAATIAASDPDATMVVLPADHVIAPTDAFQRVLRRGIELAQDGETLVTFGIAPTSPATAFGWIECGEAVDDREPRAFRVRRFREKPDAATARDFLARGGFRWNSGIFVWRIAALRRAMARSHPEFGAGVDALMAAASGPRAALARAFRSLPRISIDYAVLEHADKVVVVTAELQWNDVGSFPALAAIAPADADGNTAVLAEGAAHVALHSRNNVVYAEGNRTVATFGVEGLVVVAVGDAVLVCPRDRAGDLKTLVEHLRASGRTDLL